MASVQQSYEGKYSRLEEGEPPQKKIESEGQKLIKTLVKKQTETRISLAEELNRETNFEHGSNYISISERVHGPSRLSDFIQVVRQVDKEEVVRHVITKADLEKNEAYCPLGRQDREAALAIKPNSLETKLFQFALENEKSKLRRLNERARPDDPINRLKDLESQVLADPVRLSKKYLKKRQKMIKDSMQPEQVVENKLDDSVGANSLWDLREVKRQRTDLEGGRECLRKPAGNRQYSCKNEHSFDGEIQKSSLPSDSRVTFVHHESLKQIEFNSKKVDDEIRKLEKFGNYERGSPSNVLYIKNLPKGIKEEAIAAVFAKAIEQCDISGSVSYRLLSGKMRGQAFATFPSVKDATRVLECINGSEINGRPIIVQYGRRTTEHVGNN